MPLYTFTTGRATATFLTRWHSTSGSGSGYAGVGQMLRSEWIQTALMAHAVGVKDRAVATAPRSGGGSSARRDGKSYAESFNVSSGVERNRNGHRRAYARVSNSNHYALYIEYGNRNITAHRTLRRAAGMHL